MNKDDLRKHAIKLLRSDSAYLDDARAGARVGNTIAGSVMNLTLGAPRQNTEQAVREALTALAKVKA